MSGYFHSGKTFADDVVTEWEFAPSPERIMGGIECRKPCVGSGNVVLAHGEHGDANLPAISSKTVVLTTTAGCDMLEPVRCGEFDCAIEAWHSHIVNFAGSSGIIVDGMIDASAGKHCLVSKRRFIRIETTNSKITSVWKLKEELTVLTVVHWVIAFLIRDIHNKSKQASRAACPAILHAFQQG